MNSIFLRVFNLLKAGVMYSVARVYVYFHPLDRNKFFCVSMGGRNYGCNVKYLSDYIYQLSPKSTIIWGFAPSYYPLVKCDYKKVPFFSLRYYFEILTSKYIISNCAFNHKMLIKRKGQVYLQTWHGTALKKVGYDVSRKEDHFWFDRLFRPDALKYANNMVDVWISGSHFMTDIYRKKFRYLGNLYETGTPRNDVFFGQYNVIRTNVRNCLHVSEDEGIILYAPTFRHDGSMEYYNVNLEKLKDVWDKKTGRNHKVFVRLHPDLYQREEEFLGLFTTPVYSATLYPNMQELLCAADLLVTDYSSSMFDYMYSYKPVVLYVPDRETYYRGYYFKLEELPFMIINNNTEIEYTLLKYNYKEYISKVKHFMEEIGSVEKGNSCEQIYKILMSR